MIVPINVIYGVMLMKLLLLTDIHDRLGRVKVLAEKIVKENVAIEAVLIAGDLTYFQRAERAVKILREIRRLINVPVYFVPGNCDDPRLLVLTFDEERIYNVHGRAVHFNQYTVYGVGGSNKTPFSTPIEWSEEEIEEYVKKAWVLEPEKLIMITHVPIYGVMDELVEGHVGSRALRKLLDERQPVLWVTGHLHEYSGYVKIGGTVVVNPGPLMSGYYAVAEFSGKRDVSIVIEKL